MEEKKEKKTFTDYILSVIDYAEKNPIAASAFAVVGSAVLKFGTNLIKGKRKDKERREMACRIYDHSIDRYIYLKHPMTSCESEYFGELRRDGYSVWQAVRKMRLNKYD